MLVIGVCGSGKTNSLFNLISQQPDTDKIYLHAKDPYETKYQVLIHKRESAGLKHLNDLKLLFNTQVILMIFIKILNNTIHIRNVKYYLFLII